MNKRELKRVLAAHVRWLTDQRGGKRAELSGADLAGAELSGAELSGADLSGADLTDANLSRAKLTGANLTGANLMGASLIGAELSWTVLPNGMNLGDYGRVEVPRLCGDVCGSFKDIAAALRRHDWGHCPAGFDCKHRAAVFVALVEGGHLKRRS